MDLKQGDLTVPIRKKELASSHEGAQKDANLVANTDQACWNSMRLTNHRNRLEPVNGAGKPSQPS
ncbi:hypothetical protein SynA1840_00465 [Synechococcus sp. A18-40]|nr:hypothetical protein SynA1840_00465 [Synechococcus sp. A18-40]